MEIIMNDTMAHLQGDLTETGMTRRCIDALTVSLHQLASRGIKNLRIDCGRISRADISGLRLLYVWVQCARFTGVELELVNLSDSLHRIMHSVGLGHGFTDQMA